MTKESIKLEQVYLYELVNFEYRTRQVYKIGITDKGVKRIQEVARKAGYPYIIHHMGYCLNPHRVEAQCLKFGIPVKMAKIDGHSEFRALTSKERDQIIDHIKNNQLPSWII